MFKPTQFRAKATEYSKLAETSTDPNQRRDFQRLERRFAVLADNEQWLADNYQDSVSSAKQDRSNGITLADEEEHILRCLGAALIMQWNTLPAKLRRELFDNAGSMGALLETPLSEDKLLAFCTCTRMTRRVLQQQHRTIDAEQEDTKCHLQRLPSNDEPHNTDGLLLHAWEGSQSVEAFIGLIR